MIFRIVFAVAVLPLFSTVGFCDVIATEDFTYATGSPLAGNNGGTGWSAGWVDFAGTPATVEAGVAQLSFTGAGGFASSQVSRLLGEAVGDDESDVWIRATIQKTASLGISESFGGIGFFNGGAEVGLVGNFWPGVAADAWAAGPNGGQGEIAGELVTTLSDVIAHIDFANGVTELWVNPLDDQDIGAAEATGSGIGEFDTIVLRAGTGTAGTETWQFDDLQIGTTVGDVGAAFAVAVPEPNSAVILGAGVLCLFGRRRRSRRA